MKKLWLLLLIVPLLYGATKLTTVLIDKSSMTNSVIDSTAIGNTIPSTGKFTWTRANSSTNVPTGAANQGGYTMWNLGGGGGTGDMDFVNQRGTGTGGFSWYNADAAGNFGTLLMFLNPAGVLGTSGGFQGNLAGNANTATSLAATPIPCGNGFLQTGSQANGDSICAPYPDTFASMRAANSPVSINRGQGSYLGWNTAAGSQGESDFINVKGTGPGGFYWYNTDGVTFTPAMILNSAGNLSSLSMSAATINSSGNIAATGTVSGAAGNFTNVTAAAVNAVNVTVTGTVQGGVISGSNLKRGTAAGCTPSAAPWASCTTAIIWSTAWADSTYAASCSGVNPTSSSALIGGITKQADRVIVQVINGSGNSNVTFQTVDCLAINTP